MKKITIFLLLFLPFVIFGQSASEVAKKVTPIIPTGIVNKVKPIISNRVVPEVITSDEELDPEYQEATFKGEPDNTKYELPSEDAMTDHERYNYDLRKTAKKPK